MIVADTHTLIWLRTAEASLGKAAREALENATRERELAVSAFTFWEIAMLKRKGRLDFQGDLGLWRSELLHAGLVEIPVDGEIAIRADSLLDFHADPADRTIVATAQAGHCLVTADLRILAWGGELSRLDARL